MTYAKVPEHCVSDGLALLVLDGPVNGLLEKTPGGVSFASWLH